MKKDTQTDPRNYVIAARGTRVQEQDEIDGITYTIIGFRDLMIWNIRTQQYELTSPNNPDKFVIACKDKELAWTEFWSRWQRYTTARFHGLRNVRIEATN